MKPSPLSRGSILSRPQFRQRFFLLFCLPPCLMLCSCLSWDQRIAQIRAQYDQGQFEQASVGIEQLIASGEAKEEALALLHLGTTRFMQREHRKSSDSLEDADRKFGPIDYEFDPEAWNKYWIKEDSGNYSAPPYERVFLQVLNYLNYAALDDAEQMAREANRIDNETQRQEQVLAREYQVSSPLSHLLVGISDEMAGNFDEARTSYKKVGGTLGAFALDGIDARQDVEGKGQLIVVTLTGRSPIWSSAYDDSLVSQEIRDFEILFDAIARAVVVELTKRGDPMTEAEVRVFMATLRNEKFFRMATIDERSSRFSNAKVEVAGKSQPMVKGLDVRDQFMTWYQRVKPARVAAATSRAVVRVIARITAEREATKGTKDADLGRLIGQLTNVTLMAMDVPDTRCWTFLPDDVYVQWLTVPVGEHEVRVELGGGSGPARTVTRKIQVVEGETRFAVLGVNQ